MGKMYRRWDKFEVQDVIARYLSGEDVQAIAEEYGRSVRSIEMMIYRQGLHRREKSSADDRAKLDLCPIRSSGWAEKRTYKKPYEMEQTFEQMKDAAKEVHRRFYKYCTSSFNDIVNTDNVRDLRRVVIRYRDYVSDPRAARYIRENYADVLEALGLRIQFYIDGRVRLYLAN
uniref:hypothetical protein n=1 Tax=Alistipes putredinis TaxID=28117 RepID=UPI003FD751F6